MRRFQRFAAIDWSGAKGERQPGIALAICEAGDAAPRPVTRPGGWSRPAILDWLIEQAAAQADILIGIDFSLSLPFRDCGAFFPGWPASPPDARTLWALVDNVCASDPHLAVATFLTDAAAGPWFRRHRTPLDPVRFGPRPSGRLRITEARLLTDPRLPIPTSSFNLVGASQVGKASLSGMRLLNRLAGRVPLWPLDPTPPAGPLITEIYTAIAAIAAGRPRGRTKIRTRIALDEALAALDSAPAAPLVRYDDHSTDALVTAAWLRRVSAVSQLWHPPGLNAVRATEGWTFGVT